MSAQIKKNLKKYRSKKIVLTNLQAAEAIIDLNTLSHYNDEHFTLAKERLSLKKKIAAVGN